jgi:hypothetical protein
MRNQRLNKEFAILYRTNSNRVPLKKAAEHSICSLGVSHFTSGRNQRPVSLFTTHGKSFWWGITKAYYKLRPGIGQTTTKCLLVANEKLRLWEMLNVLTNCCPAKGRKCSEWFRYENQNIRWCWKRMLALILLPMLPSPRLLTELHNDKTIEP